MECGQIKFYQVDKNDVKILFLDSINIDNIDEWDSIPEVCINSGFSGSRSPFICELSQRNNDSILCKKISSDTLVNCCSSYIDVILSRAECVLNSDEKSKDTINNIIIDDNSKDAFYALRHELFSFRGILWMVIVFAMAIGLIFL